MNTLTIILACLGSSGLFELIKFLISRRDGKKSKLASLEENVSKLEKDSIRMQMLVLMSDYPDEKAEIMKLAKYYFEKLKGNFYMESLFLHWLQKNNLPKPHWFNFIEGSDSDE